MSAFDKVIGYENIKAELIRYCDVLKNREKYNRLGVQLPRGILLDGDPGLGKTLMAKCFIEECGLKYYLIRKDKPDGAFVDEIRSIFEKAKSDSIAIVFLDDMDKYANEDMNHIDAEEYVTVQSCIDDCRDYNIFVIATVNDQYCLPESLRRAGRFDKIIRMRCPSGKDAEDIVRFYLSQKQVIGEVDVEEIARITEGHSCAELETVINEAGIYAGFDGRDKISQKDLVKSCMRLLFCAPEAIDSKYKKYLEHVAIHETGHALVGEMLDPGSISFVSICNYTGYAAGITVYQNDDEFRTIKEAEIDVMRSLGGKAATEVILNQVDVGCKNDIKHAYSTVVNLIADYCEYGFDSYVWGDNSDYLLENKDRRVDVEMVKYYEMTKQIIFDNREFFNALYKELFDKLILTYKDIKRLREQFL